MGDHFYTADPAERDRALAGGNYRWEEIQCYVFAPRNPQPGNTTPFYRLYNRDSGDHFYTTDASERDSAIARSGYVSEGVACFVYTSNLSGTTPLYRLWNGDASDHFYTTDSGEASAAESNSGYRGEGIACYVLPYASPMDTPLFRLYAPTTSWWDDFVDAFGDALSSIGNAVGDWVSDGLETIGNALGDALRGIGSALSEIPGLGWLDDVFHWAGDLLSSFTDFLGSVIKGVLNFVGGALGGLIKVVGGLFTGHWGLVSDGFGDIAASFVGAVIGIGGKAIAVAQTFFGLQWNKRTLTTAERDMLTLVFRNSVAFFNVRVVDGFAGLFSASSRPFTLGDVIYMKDTPPADYHHTLVHECTHVWQYQHVGYRYTSDSVFGPDDKYDWEAEFSRGHGRWQDFNVEAEGAFIEEVWQTGRRDGAVGNGSFYTDDPIGNDVYFADAGGVDFTEFARLSIAYLRAFSTYRPSRGK